MFSIDEYMTKLTGLLRNAFGARLLYVGLQGSYQRGEAGPQSDIDVMVVLDTLSVSDLDRYRVLLKEAGEAERACGFLCGAAELAAWNPYEICHLLHTTEDRYGRLAPLVPAYRKEDIRAFVKISLDNLYHELCHRYLYADREENIAALQGSYKSVFFLLQNLMYLRTGEFVKTKRDLSARLSGAEKMVMAWEQKLSHEKSYDFDMAFRVLFEWCRNTICEIG